MARYDDAFKRAAVAQYWEARPGYKSDREARITEAATLNVPANSLRDWIKAFPGPVSAPSKPARSVAGVVDINTRTKPSPARVGPVEGGEGLEDAYVEAVKAMAWLESSDKGLVAAGRQLARNVDEVLKSPDATPTDKTKALYLTPHLVNVLRELGGTPGTRKELTAGEQKMGGKLAALRANENGRKKNA